MYIEPTCPPANDEPFIWTGETVEATVKTKAVVAVAGFPAASFTRTANEDLPPCAGAPAMTPEAAFNISPLGKAPEERLQVYGFLPPIAASVTE